MPNNDEIMEHDRILTDADVNYAWFRWHFFAHISQSIERLQALGICGALAPTLRNRRNIYNTQTDFSFTQAGHNEAFGDFIFGVNL